MQPPSSLYRSYVVIAICAALVACSTLASSTETRQMVITIDDLPAAPGNRPSNAEAKRITDALLKTLVDFDVPAIGFVNESKLRDKASAKLDPSRVALIEQWLEAGLVLGNHGFKHLDLHRVPPDDWEQDILDGERVLRPLIAKHGRTLRYFRHPFLHTGRSIEIRDRTSEFLHRHGYQVAPVTIDNQEWIFAAAYADTKDPKQRKRLAVAYCEYMKQMVRYFEDQTLAIVGEPMPQILLIHANALNADWLHELLSFLQERGYEFVPLAVALEHTAFSRPDQYDGPAGITWLHRWAITAGMPKTTFGDEPELPAWVPSP